MKHLIILIGGPGKFVGCDKAHDQTWTNYIVPMQLTASQNLYKREATETVHWVVYEPSYRERWLDDSIITKIESKKSDGYWLHSNRKRATDKVKSKGATNYIHRIKMIAASNSITYKGISTPSEFWSYLESFPNNSINRVWYSGHASKAGLLLSLTHDGSCTPGASKLDIVFNTEIIKHSKLIDKFSIAAKHPSKFYGCYTSEFAKEWHTVFGMPAEGAVNKIDFGSIDRPSSIKNILERIQKTHTSKGSPDWKAYP